MRKKNEATEIYCDNKFILTISKNPVSHGRSKHIKVKFHAIREAKREEINLVHCSIENQLEICLQRQ